ncbi:Uncharacterised protein [Burkholderia cenocepacia]|nr:Uncharacterised protein [Burkholderia cenocepacia]
MRPRPAATRLRRRRHFLAGGAGLAKGGVRGMAALGKVGAAEGAELTKTASAAGKVLKTEGAVAEGAKAADAPTAVGKATGATEGAGAGDAVGDGAKVLRRRKSLRERYLGRTPGKNSRTGKEVQRGSKRKAGYAKIRSLERKSLSTRATGIRLKTLIWRTKRTRLPGGTMLGESMGRKLQRFVHGCSTPRITICNHTGSTDPLVLNWANVIYPH